MREKMEKQGMQKVTGHGRDRPGTGRSMPPAVAVLLVLFLMALASAVYFYTTGKRNAGEAEGLKYEANIVEGDIPGKSRQERQRELDAIVEEGMLAMSINATPVGKITGADQSINWLIENPVSQGKLIRVEVWRDETEEKIYETGAIPPGNYVESAPLTVSLPAGQYRCTARFYAYREDTEAYIGQAAAQIRLTLYE